MGNLRSIHGGADSHLCIEVQPVRGFGQPDGLETCAHEPETAQAFGVYVRNPLAFHLQDFGPETVADGAPRQTMPQALAMAFEYADSLAEHLGCPVVSPLERPAPVPEHDPAAPDQSDLVEAAACLWEGALALLHPIPANPTPGEVAALSPAARVLWRMVEEHGTSAARCAVISWAEECHRAWFADGGLDRDDSFDWDFAPAWLATKLEGVE